MAAGPIDLGAHLEATGASRGDGFLALASEGSLSRSRGVKATPPCDSAWTLSSLTPSLRAPTQAAV